MTKTNRPQVADAFSRSEKVTPPVEQVKDTQDSVEKPQDAPQGTEQANGDQTPILTIDDLAGTITELYDERKKKKTVEETHKRTTFLLRNDLAKRLDALSRNKKGYKTLVLNQAVEAILNKLEKK